MHARDAALEAKKFQGNSEKFQAMYAEIGKKIEQEAMQGAKGCRVRLKDFSYGQALSIRDTLTYERGYKCEVDYTSYPAKIIVRW